MRTSACGLIYALLVVLLGGLYFFQQRMVAARAAVSPTMSPGQQKLMQYLPVVFADLPDLLPARPRHLLHRAVGVADPAAGLHHQALLRSRRVARPAGPAGGRAGARDRQAGWRRRRDVGPGATATWPTPRRKRTSGKQSTGKQSSGKQSSGKAQHDGAAPARPADTRSHDRAQEPSDADQPTLLHPRGRVAIVPRAARSAETQYERSRHGMGGDNG